MASFLNSKFQICTQSNAEFASSGDESDSDENCRSVKPSEGTTRADADVCILMEEWR